VVVLQRREKQLTCTDALQILGVLPRTPEPTPLEHRDPESLTPTEMLELIRRQKVRQDTPSFRVVPSLLPFCPAHLTTRRLSAKQIRSRSRRRERMPTCDSLKPWLQSSDTCQLMMMTISALWFNQRRRLAEKWQWSSWTERRSCEHQLSLPNVAASR